MKLLLDTCTFLWLVQGNKNIPVTVRDTFSDPDNDIYLSVISAWEVNIKYQLGRLSLPLAPELFISKERERHLIASLELTEADTLHLANLPDVHKDPFDRMLVCQAIEQSLTILTPDPDIRKYPIRTLW